MNPTPQKSLCKIGIEFDYLVVNPTLRDMFTRTEVDKDPFLHGIKVENLIRPSTGEICGVELTGSPDALRKFFDKFLRDEEPHAYSLSYLDE